MTNVLIVEDLRAAQVWLTGATLMAMPEAKISCFSRVRRALSWLESNTPALCLIDLSLPDGSGIDCILAAKRLNPAPAVLVVTMFNDDRHVLPAIQAGADGYLLKEEPKANIAEAICRVLAQQPALSAQITLRLMQIVQDQAASPRDACPLTLREQEILCTVAKGLHTADVAKMHHISPHTAAKHLKNIYAKLGIHSRTEAVHEAIRFGLISRDIP